ncbi:uncharacterized protein LOC143227093 [Tachypleus tridentatus]|uniref:uncharacterized protein LOC143227093 n=1 Tax=Tachypleus tridentatus TaxID=6853 RepID=UPI003FD66D56
MKVLFAALVVLVILIIMNVDASGAVSLQSNEIYEENRKNLNEKEYTKNILGRMPEWFLGTVRRLKNSKFCRKLERVLNKRCKAKRKTEIIKAIPILTTKDNTNTLKTTTAIPSRK